MFNEEPNIVPLYEAIRGALDPTGMAYEVVFVNDGSTDGTAALLRGLVRADPWVRVVQLRKNFGQTPAMRAGIDHACGEVIVTMDGDLQNDPSDIPVLLEKMKEGYDLVVGWRRDRKDALISRKFPSRVANWLIARVTGATVHDTGCSLKAYRAGLIKELPLYSDLHRFIPAVCVAAGGRVAEVVVRHNRRHAGQSKYGWSRLGKVLLDLVFVRMVLSSSCKPSHLFAFLTVPFLALTALAGALTLVTWAPGLAGGPALAWPTVTLLSAYLTAHLLLFGVLADLVAHTGLTWGGDRVRFTERVRTSPVLRCPPC